MYHNVLFKFNMWYENSVTPFLYTTDDIIKLNKKEAANQKKGRGGQGGGRGRRIVQGGRGRGKGAGPSQQTLGRGGGSQQQGRGGGNKPGGLGRRRGGRGGAQVKREGNGGDDTYPVKCTSLFLIFVCETPNQYSMCGLKREEVWQL